MATRSGRGEVIDQGRSYSVSKGEVGGVSGAGVRAPSAPSGKSGDFSVKTVNTGRGESGFVVVDRTGKAVSGVSSSFSQASQTAAALDSVAKAAAAPAPTAAARPSAQPSNVPPAVITTPPAPLVAPTTPARPATVTIQTPAGPVTYNTANVGVGVTTAPVQTTAEMRTAVANQEVVDRKVAKANLAEDLGLGFDFVTEKFTAQTPAGPREVNPLAPAGAGATTVEVRPTAPPTVVGRPEVPVGALPAQERGFFDTVYENLIGSGAIDTTGEALGAQFGAGTRDVLANISDFAASLLPGAQTPTPVRGIGLATTATPAAESTAARVAGQQALADIAASQRAQAAATTATIPQQYQASIPVTGNIFDPSTWAVSPNASLAGTAAAAARMAPSVLSTMIPGVGVLSGAAQAGGAAINETRNYLTQLENTPLPNGQTQLEASSPVYRDALARTGDRAAALAETVRQAENYVAPVAAAIGGIGGGATEALTRSVISKGLAANFVGKTALSALEEGTQEVAETVGARTAANIATGTAQDIGAGTVEQFVGGALAGAPVGAVSGFGGVAPPTPTPAPTTTPSGTTAPPVIGPTAVPPGTGAAPAPAPAPPVIGPTAVPPGTGAAPAAPVPPGPPAVDPLDALRDRLRNFTETAPPAPAQTQVTQPGEARITSDVDPRLEADFQALMRALRTETTAPPTVETEVRTELPTPTSPEQRAAQDTLVRDVVETGNIDPSVAADAGLTLFEAQTLSDRFGGRDVAPPTAPSVVESPAAPSTQLTPAEQTFLDRFLETGGIEAGAPGADQLTITEADRFTQTVQDPGSVLNQPEVQEQVTTIRDLTETRDTLVDQLDTLEREQTRLSGQPEGADMRLADLEAQIAELQGQLSARQTELDQAKSTLQGEIGGRLASELRLSETQTALGQAEEGRTALEGELEAANQARDALSGQLQEAQTTAAERQAELDRQMQRETRLQEDMAFKNDEISQLQGQISSLDEQLAARQAELDAASGDLTSSQADLDALNQQMTDLQAEKSGLEADLTNARNEQTSLQGTLDAVTQERTALQERLDAALLAQQDSQAQFEAAQQELEGLNRTLESAQQERTALEQQLEQQSQARLQAEEAARAQAQAAAQTQAQLEQRLAEQAQAQVESEDLARTQAEAAAQTQAQTQSELAASRAQAEELQRRLNIPGSSIFAGSPQVPGFPEEQAPLGAPGATSNIILYPDYGPPGTGSYGGTAPVAQPVGPTAPATTPAQVTTTPGGTGGGPTTPPGGGPTTPPGGGPTTPPGGGPTTPPGGGPTTPPGGGPTQPPGGVTYGGMRRPMVAPFTRPTPAGPYAPFLLQPGAAPEYTVPYAGGAQQPGGGIGQFLLVPGLTSAPQPAYNQQQGIGALFGRRT